MGKFDFISFYGHENEELQKEHEGTPYIKGTFLGRRSWVVKKVMYED